MGLFEPQISRRPNKYPWTVDAIKAMRNGFWTPDEFSFKEDYHSFKTQMDDPLKQVVVRVLTAIGQIEIAVKTFWGDIGKTLPHPYISDLGYTMANQEVIHNDAYEKLLVDVLGLEKAFEENLEHPVLAGRVKYLRKYLEKSYSDDRKQFIYALVLFTLFVESVSLFSQFYVIRWINRETSYLKDTSQQVQYTRLEEDIHAKVGVLLIRTIREEYPELWDDDLIQKILDESYQAFIAESALIDWILQGYEGPRLSARVLKEFVKDRINQSLRDIDLPEIFTLNKDYLRETEWFDLEVIGGTMTDFFHKRPVEYNKHNRSYDEALW